MQNLNILAVFAQFTTGGESKDKVDWEPRIVYQTLGSMGCSQSSHLLCSCKYVSRHPDVHNSVTLSEAPRFPACVQWSRCLGDGRELYGSL